MRILIATHFFADDLIGGTEVLTLNLARQLHANGHEVAVICADDWSSAPDDRVRVSDDNLEGIAVRRLHFSWMNAPDVFRYLYNNPVAERLTAEYIDEFQPDILHVTSCYSLSGSVIKGARFRRVPIVLTATDYWFLCGRNTLLKHDGSLCCGRPTAWDCTQCMLAETKLYRLSTHVLPDSIARTGFRAVGNRPFFTRQRGLRGLHGNWDERARTLRGFLNDVDLIVSASSHLRYRLVEFGAPAQRVITSAYGLDSSWATGFTTKTPSKRLRFGFIGQAIPMKGVDLLLRAATSVSRDIDFQLKVYGNLDKDADYGDRLRSIANEDPRIHFCGTFPNDEMGNILASVDVLVVPSIWYDFPLVIPSAFATRTPVIATNLPGMNEMVSDGESGLLFDRGNWRQLAMLMEEMAANPGRARCLAEGVPVVKSDVEMAAEYEQIYTSLVNAGYTAKTRRSGAGSHTQMNPSG